MVVSALMETRMRERKRERERERGRERARVCMESEMLTYVWTKTRWHVGKDQRN